MEYPCVVCSREVRPRQHAVACDQCERWQHRTCGTGINAKQYRAAVRGNKDIPFICRDCQKRDSDHKPRAEDIATKTNLPDTGSHTPEHKTHDIHATIQDTLPAIPTPEPIKLNLSPARPGADPSSPTLTTVTGLSGLEPISLNLSPARPCADRSSSTASRALFPDTSSSVDTTKDTTTSTEGQPIDDNDSVGNLSFDIPGRDFSRDPASVFTNHRDLDLNTAMIVPSPDPLCAARTDRQNVNYLGPWIDCTSPDNTPRIATKQKVTKSLDKSFFTSSSSDTSDQSDSEPEIKPVTYRVIKEGSIMGKDLLTDSNGYSYCVKRTQTKHISSRIHWRCSVRTQYWSCHATVTQTGSTFTTGPINHNHFPQIQKSKDAELIVQIRAKVERRPSTSGKSARTIVHETLKEAGRTTPLSDRNLELLMRRTNRIKAKHRQMEASKENKKEQATKMGYARREYLEMAVPENGLAKLDTHVLFKKVQNGQNTKSSSAPRTTLPAPHKKPQSTTTYTTARQSVPITTSGSLPQRPQPSVHPTSSSANKHAPGTTVTAPQTKPQHGTSSKPPTAPATLPTTKQPTVTNTNKLTLPTKMSLPTQDKTQHQTKTSDVNMLKQSSTVTSHQQKQHVQTSTSTVNNQGTSTTTSTSVDNQQTKLTSSNKKRKHADTLTFEQRYQQMLKRPRYERSARSIVEESLRDQGIDPANPPHGYNVPALIQTVQRFRRKTYLEECQRYLALEECQRYLAENQSDVSKTLRPPTETPMEADPDCLQGKEEDRYF